jgi:hypothetical protein
LVNLVIRKKANNPIFAYKKLSVMNLLVRFPCIVEQYAPEFKDLFSDEGYRYFRRFLSGILVSDNKTLDGINRLFVLERRNQSSFNRFIHCQNFDLTKLNSRRVNLMQQTESTRFKSSSGDSGVLSLDDTLMSHYGSHFENIYNLYDYVNKKYALAHNLVSVHYSDDRTDYPVFHHLWEPPDWEAVAIKMRELGIHINEEKWENRTTEKKKWHSYMRDRFRDYQYKKAELQKVYKSKIILGLEMLRQFRRDYPDVNLPVALDGGYTSAEACKIIDQELEMAYVGSLSEDQKVVLAGSKQISLIEFLKQLIEQHQAGKLKFYKTTVHYKGKEEIHYAYCGTHRINGFVKQQRLVISFCKEDLSDTPRFSISNQTHWHSSGILRIRRHRWPIETFHQEGKAEGLDKYQLRDFEAIKTHIALVSTAFTMLKRAAHDDELLSVFRKRLQIESNGTLPLLRRLLQLEGLMALVEFVHIKVNEGKSIENILQQLMQPVAY